MNVMSKGQTLDITKKIMQYRKLNRGKATGTPVLPLFSFFCFRLEYDNYNYYQIQPSFGPSNGRGNYRFLTGGIKGILMSKETSMNYVTVRETSGQTQRATIHCLNPGERLPQHMCARSKYKPENFLFCFLFNILDFSSKLN